MSSTQFERLRPQIIKTHKEVNNGTPVKLFGVKKYLNILVDCTINRAVLTKPNVFTLYRNKYVANGWVFGVIIASQFVKFDRNCDFGVVKNHLA